MNDYFSESEINHLSKYPEELELVKNFFNDVKELHDKIMNSDLSNIIIGDSDEIAISDLGTDH